MAEEVLNDLEKSAEVKQFLNDVYDMADDD